MRDPHTLEVPMLRFRVGAFHVAIELERITSLTPRRELAPGIAVYDPASDLGGMPGAQGRVGVLEPRTASVALAIGDVEAFETWNIRRLAALPDWLYRHAPPVFKKACGLGDDGTIVWIFDAGKICQRMKG